VLGFQLAVQTWVGRGKRRGGLLSGRELRRALTHNDTVLAGGALGERTEFLRLSVRRRDQRRATIAFASVVVLVVFFWGGRLYTDFQHRQTLAAWGVPGDLYDHQSQLVDLSIAVPITDLGWVRAPLRSLTIISNSPRILLTALPSSLRTLSMHVKELESLNGLPGLLELTDLDLSGSAGLTSLAGIQKLQKLTTLNLSGASALTSLAGIDNLKNLTTLNLTGASGLPSLAGVEKLQNLRTLDLSGISDPSFVSIEKLPNLNTLSTTGVIHFANSDKLNSLTTLNLNGASGLTSFAGIEKLPNLTILRLVGADLVTLAGIEELRKLTTLDLTVNAGLVSLAGIDRLPNLTTLTLAGNARRSKSHQRSCLGLPRSHL
jgi:Leucine-rich repeat (LRR) protein